jgi:hypothetical protein
MASNRRSLSKYRRSQRVGTTLSGKSYRGSPRGEGRKKQRKRAAIAKRTRHLDPLGSTSSLFNPGKGPKFGLTAAQIKKLANAGAVRIKKAGRDIEVWFRRKTRRKTNPAKRKRVTKRAPAKRKTAKRRKR